MSLHHYALVDSLNIFKIRQILVLSNVNEAVLWFKYYIS